MISINTTIAAPIEKVWQFYTSPEHVTQWNFASEDWHCPSASIALEVGGKLTYRIEAKAFAALQEARQANGLQFVN